MASTFERCPKSIDAMVKKLQTEFASTYEPLFSAGVTIDLVFAYAELDEKTGVPKAPALTKNGQRALGLTRKIPLKDRALGRADTEIALDGDWWKESTESEQFALLDHELYHICVKIDKRGLVRDDLGRPCIVLRDHDYEFGWFNQIAQRHGVFSQEQKQAAKILYEQGKHYWPELSAILDEKQGKITISAEGLGVQPITMSTGRFSHIAKSMPKAKKAEVTGQRG